MRHPVEVLHVERLGQPELSPQPLEVLLGRLRAQHDLRGVAGGEVQHEEDHHGDAEQHGDEEEEPPREVAPHGAELT